MNKYILFFSAAFVLFGCENAFFDEDLASNDPQANFDYLWREVDEKYAYFDVKQIDWNQIRSQYQPNIFAGMPEDSLFNVLGAMLNNLRDDHTNLASNFQISRFGVVYEAQDNFDFRLLEDNYLGRDYYITGPFQHSFLENKRIAYVRFPAFTGMIDGTNLDYILERYQDTEGLVLDLRENGGGAVTDVFNLLGRFVKERTLVIYSQIKNGPGHDDFSEPEPAFLDPKGVYYGKKVIVLVDRGTYSAGSFTSLATKALDNMLLMGDTTGGGLGLPNGGQLPNGWTYRFSITRALTLDKDASYENGVPPDVHVAFDWSDLTTDEILEAAIDEIL